MKDLHFPARIVRFDIVSLCDHLERKCLGFIDLRGQTACHMVAIMVWSNVDSWSNRIFNNSRSLRYFSCAYDGIAGSNIFLLV